MGLAAALSGLSDDRDTRDALHTVLRYLSEHSGQLVDEARLASVTGLSDDRVGTVMRALDAAFVVDCGSGAHACTYAPTPAVRTEVDCYLRSATRVRARRQGNVERFRDRYPGQR